MKLVALALAALFFPFRFVKGDLLRDLTLLDDMPSLTSMLEPPSSWFDTSLSTWFDRPSYFVRRPFLTNMMWSPMVVSLPYEDRSTDAEFRINMTLPSTMSVDDVHVNVEHAGRMLTVAGRQQLEASVSTFQKSFSLDPSVVVEELTATYTGGGVLTVKAPKDPHRVQPHLRSIPITQLAIEGRAVKDAKKEVRTIAEPVPKINKEAGPNTAFATKAAMKKAVEHESKVAGEKKQEEFVAQQKKVKSELRRRT